MVKMFHSFGAKHSLWDLYNDFLKMAAITLSNTCDLIHRKEREEEYVKVAKNYTSEEITKFAHILAELVQTLDENPGDILGELFMLLELGNKLNGQFFTPYDVCVASASMTLNDVDALLKKKNFITVYEPACGGGAMVIAASQVIKEKGFNPQKVMLADCTDLDAKAVYMTYIQLSLLGIPAIIRHGNTLTLEQYGEWYTPMYVVGGWSFKKQSKFV